MYWILVMTEYNDYNPGSTDAVINNLIEEKIWKIGDRTRNKDEIKENDKIVFYIAGRDNGYFIAKSVISSEYINEGKNNIGFIKLSNITIFDKKVYIKPLIKRLIFIKNKQYYGLSLKNGIVKIDEASYKLIIKKGISYRS
jgi:predicted RNA-binding protein